MFCMPSKAALDKLTVQQIGVYQRCVSQNAMSRRRMQCTPFPPTPFPAHRGEGGDIGMGLRPIPGWGLTAPDPGAMQCHIALHKAGAGRQPCWVAGEARSSFFPRPREERGRGAGEGVSSACDVDSFHPATAPQTPICPAFCHDTPLNQLPHYKPEVFS